MSVASLGFFRYIVEGVEHQQRVLELGRCQGAEFGVVQRFDQSGDVVAAEHHAQQSDGVGAIDQRRAGFAPDDGGEEAGLDIGCGVDAGRHPVGDQIDQ